MATDKEEKVTQEDRVAYRKKMAARTILAYRRQCIGIGLFVVSFLILLAAHQVTNNTRHLSISHYYFDNRNLISGLNLPVISIEGFRLGDVLVGLLSAVAVFLILFSGLSKGEDRCLSAAGLMLLGVALFPTDLKQSSGCSGGLGPGACLPRGLGGSLADGINIHIVFAVVFFALIAIVAICFAPKRAKYLKWSSNTKPFKWRFRIIGFGMIGAPLAVFLVYCFDLTPIQDMIFWVEWFGIAFFAAYWFLKFHEFGKILTNEQMGKNESRLKLYRLLRFS